MEYALAPLFLPASAFRPIVVFLLKIFKKSQRSYERKTSKRAMQAQVLWPHPSVARPAQTFSRSQRWLDITQKYCLPVINHKFR